MIASEVREMLSFIDGNPTAYHTTAAVRDILRMAVYQLLYIAGRAPLWWPAPGGSR